LPGQAEADVEVFERCLIFPVTSPLPSCCGTSGTKAWANRARLKTKSTAGADIMPAI